MCTALVFKPNQPKQKMNSPIENINTPALGTPNSLDFEDKWAYVTEQICPHALKDDPEALLVEPGLPGYFQAFMAANKDRWQRTPASTKVA
jgi:hypothetical protein